MPLQDLVYLYIEQPKTTIVWVTGKHRPKVVTSLGIQKIRQIIQYLLIEEVGVGGSIIDQIIENLLLLDNGYLISRRNVRNIRDRNNTRQFLKRAKNYVKLIRSNAQRDLAGVRLAIEFLHENKLIKTLAAMNCEN